MTEVRRILASMTTVERDLFVAKGGVWPRGLRMDESPEWHRPQKFGEAHQAWLRRQHYGGARRHSDRRHEVRRRGNVRRLGEREKKIEAKLAHRLGDYVVIQRGRLAGQRAVICRRPRQLEKVIVRIAGQKGEQQVPVAWIRAEASPRSAA